MRAAPVLVLAMLAGCIGPQGAGEDLKYGFGGRFEAGTTEDERREVYAAIRGAGGIVEITMDQPTSHFGGGRLSWADCGRLSAWADGLDHVTVHVPRNVDENDY